MMSYLRSHPVYWKSYVLENVMAFDSQELWRGWKFHEQQVTISFILNVDNFCWIPIMNIIGKGFSFQPLVTNVSKTRHPSCLRLSSKEVVWGLSGQRMSLQYTLSKNIVGKNPFLTQYPTTRLWSSWDKSIRQLLVSKLVALLLLLILMLRHLRLKSPSIPRERTRDELIDSIVHTRTREHRAMPGEH